MTMRLSEAETWLLDVRGVVETFHICTSEVHLKTGERCRCSGPQGRLT